MQSASGARIISVLVRRRVSEAMRMAVGLTVLNDAVSVCIMEPIGELDDMTAQYVEALGLMGVTVYSVHSDTRFMNMNTEALAASLLEAHAVIAY